MRYAAVNALLLALLSLSVACATSQPEPLPGSSFSQALTPNEVDRPLERVVMARRSMLTRKAIGQPLDDAQIKACAKLLSKCMMEEYQLFLSPFADYEKALLEDMARREPPIISRTHLVYLRGILKNKALMAPRYAKRQGVPVNIAVTPGVEERLFGAYNCVFATVGSPDGTPRYGEVLIKLKPSVKSFGWATPWSGFNFIANTRAAVYGRSSAEFYKDPGIDGKYPLTFDDMSHFSLYVVDGSDWNRALGYQAILFLRQMRESEGCAKMKATPAEFVEALLKKRGDDFWFTLMNLDVCYLEAKFDDMVSSDYFESIEVPAGSLEEILSWPESEPFRDIIRAKGVSSR
jgi:hypothetical protein